MRLGAPLFASYDSPESFVRAVNAAGWSAANCPVKPDADDATIHAYADAAKNAGIIISEVGAWSNPISPDPKQARDAIEICKKRLALADKLGARSCVNIAGSRNPDKWDGPHRDNFSRDTFDLIVHTVRDIIDSVKPTRTCYALEMMPWIFPEAPDDNLALIRAIDRKAFGVHVDPVNIVSSARRWSDNGALIREIFSKLGPWIRTCHGKDIRLANNLTTHLDECRPGTGDLDYDTYLREIEKLGPDTPLMLEHLPNEAEYRLAAEHVRTVARRAGITIL